MSGIGLAGSTDGNELLSDAGARPFRPSCRVVYWLGLLRIGRLVRNGAAFSVILSGYCSELVEAQAQTAARSEGDHRLRSVIRHQDAHHVYEGSATD